MKSFVILRCASSIKPNCNPVSFPAVRSFSGLVVCPVNVNLAIFDLGDGLNDGGLELVHCSLYFIAYPKKGEAFSGAGSGLHSIEVSCCRVDLVGGVDEFVSLQLGQWSEQFGADQQQ
jgi:hypothetical protein